MALSRKFLESLGLEADKVSVIIDAHAETVDALKKQADAYKEDAEKLPGVQKELNAANTELEAIKNEGGDWQKKFEKVNSEFEAYKKSQAENETLASKKEAYKALLKEAGINSEKLINSIISGTDLNALEIENGAIKDAKTKVADIQKEWDEFIPRTETSGAKVSKPPINDNSKKFSKAEIEKMTEAEINANWDAVVASLQAE